MTTYKKLTWDSYKIQVESAVRDGNGATISTTYATKTELTTGLGTKLDSTVAASTYLTIANASSTYLSKTDAASTYATQTALAGKADKATSLAGYGITDGVTTNTTQTITAAKTFNMDNQALGFKATQPYVSSTILAPYISFIQNNDVPIGTVYGAHGATFHSVNLQAWDPSTSGWAQFSLVADSGVGYCLAPYRNYNSAYTTDVVTIGSLAANPNVVHTTGNETVNGVKTFTGSIYLSSDKIRIFSPNDPTMKRISLWAIDTVGDVTAVLELRALDSGAAKLYLRRFNASGQAIDETQIATLG